MRKPRKGSTSDFVGPPIPQPPQPAEVRHTVPTCLSCGNPPAKELLHVGQKLVFRAFCSIVCAIDHALNDVKARGLVWCTAHGHWSGKGLVCPGCYELKVKIEQAASERAAAVQAVEGEVQS